MNTLDDELIQQLRLELDALTADVSGTAPPLTSAVAIASIVTMPRQHDRRRALVLAAAMVALIAAVAALVAVRRDGGAVGSTETSVGTAPRVTSVTAAVPPVGAHVIPPSPEGWEPLEWGNVRLSLPPDMSPFHVGNGCTSDPGTDLQITCGEQSVRISDAPATAATDQLVNGLNASWQAGECAGCQTMVLPELLTTITVKRHDDASANAILATVSPSGTWRYGYEIRPTPAADWKTVNFEGVSIRVPSDWPVLTVSESDPPRCPNDVVADTVILDNGISGHCDDPLLVAPISGVHLYLAKPPLPINLGWPQQVIASGTGGDTPMVVARVGYGADPRIGLSILSSFTGVSSDPSNTYPTVPTPVDVPYFAVGESVMLGAKPDLEAHGIKTVAEVSKGPDWTLQQLQLAKTRYNITHSVIIQLGTNGTVTREQYDAVINQFPNLNLIVVMTVKAPKPWIPANNEIIRSLPLTHPNVKVLDWEASSAEVADHLSQSDGGIHLGDDVSKAFYTNLILGALGLPT